MTMTSEALQKLKAMKNTITSIPSQPMTPKPPTREVWIARECALKCSVEMASAWGGWMAANSKEMSPESVAKNLKMNQEAWYKEFLEDITKDDDSIPF